MRIAREATTVGQLRISAQAHGRCLALALVLLAAVLTACAPREVLVRKPAEPPPGIDFSGLWELLTDAEAERRRLDDAIRRTDGVDEGDLLPRPPLGMRQREPMIVERPDIGGLVHVFLQHGRRLRITQTASGIFVSFDRAVVEEFRFGEHRQVQVGPVVADRVSGWVGNAYVVETLGEDNMKLTERYEFGGNRDTLRRTIVLRGRNQETVTIVQEFDRTDL